VNPVALMAAVVAVSTPSGTFSPSTVQITEGDSVTWNLSGGDHNVRFAGEPAGPFQSTYSKTFPAAGTFTYVCDAHSGMRGAVVVSKAAVAPTPGPTPPVVPGSPQSVPQGGQEGNGVAVAAIRAGRSHLRFVTNGPVIGQATILQGRGIRRFVRFQGGPGLVKAPFKRLRPGRYRIVLRYNGEGPIRKSWVVK
jgi:hypothetical protein